MMPLWLSMWLVVLAVIMGQPSWADTTEFSLKRKDYTCLGQPYPEAAPSNWVKAEELVTIRNKDEHDPCDKDGYPYELADLAPLRNLGKVVVAPLSGCSKWTEWEDYRRDFSRRLTILNSTSPAGIIFGEAHPGKLPEWFWTMDEVLEMEASHLLPPPVCTMDKWQFEKLIKDVDTFGGKGAVFSSAALFHSESAPIISPAITSIEIETQVGEEAQVIEVPAATSAFNPVETETVYEHIVGATFKDICYGDAGKRNFSQCADCWSSYYFLSDGPPERTWEMRDAVVFFDTTSGSVMCFEWLYNFVIIAQVNGAKGVLVASSSTDELWISSPYLVSEKVEIPLFSVTKTAASVIKYALESSKSVKVRFPALSGRAGPAFYAKELFLEGWTDIAFWDLSANSDDQDYDNHFECSAGYAASNGDVERLPAPVFYEGLVVNGTRLWRGRPAGDCGDALACGACFHQTQRIALNDAHSFVEGDVILIRTDDFPCFHENHYYFEMVKALNPGGVVLSAESGHMPTGTLLNDARKYSFPIFFIRESCFTRVTKDMDEMYVSLAGRKDDTDVYAGYTLNTEHETLEETVVKVHDPKELRGVYLAGQSAFNPNHSFAHSAEIVVLQVVEECSGGETCHECDSLGWKFLNSPNTLSGKIAVFSEGIPVSTPESIDSSAAQTTFNGNAYTTSEQGFCLRPYTSVIRQAQESGALAVIFVNWDSEVYTLQVPGHGDIQIPSFNIPLNFGIDLMWEALYGDGEGVVMEIPRVTKGVAFTLDEFAEEMESSPDVVISGPLQLLLEERDKLLRASRPTEKPKKAATQQALIAVLLTSITAVLLAAFGVVLWLRLKKRRQMRYLSFSEEPTSNPLGAKKGVPQTELATVQSERIQTFQESDCEEISLSAVEVVSEANA